MTDEEGLPDGWCESAERIAGYSASHHRGQNRWLTHQEKREAALDAIIEHVHDHGWPAPGESFRPLFYAAANGIARANYDRHMHPRHWSYWHPVPSEQDALAERVTDRIGVYQLLDALGDKERDAVLALAEVLKDTSIHQRKGSPEPTATEQAAALLGVDRAVYGWRLKAARKKARSLWVAPGDTPFSTFSLYNGGNRHRFGAWQADQEKTRKQRAAAHEQDATSGTQQ